MPTFTYHARDSTGRPIKGVLEAESPVALVEHLRKMGYLVTGLKEAAADLKNLPALRWMKGVSQESLLLGVIQLANMVEAGVPLTMSLNTVAAQSGSPTLRETLESVRASIESGASLSDAMRHHPTVFPKLLDSLVAVGEASGQLATVLNRFAHFMERDVALKRDLQGALTYPAFLLVAATILILFLVTFVIPQFSSIFVKTGIPLPLPTQILARIGSTLRGSWPGILLLGGILSVAAVWLRRVPRVKLLLDRGCLALPMVGRVIHQTLMARFARTFGTLVASGVPILTALDTAKEVVENRVMGEELTRVRLAVERGERIAPSLSKGQVFYPDAIQMIRVGEESGRLDFMLDKIADFYELRVNFALKQLTTLLEPILLVGMGGVVAFIMASLLLPMFDMVKVFQRGGIR